MNYIEEKLIEKYRHEVSVLGLVFVLLPQERYELLNGRRNNVNKRVTDISGTLK
jgi:hypothetical protein